MKRLVELQERHRIDESTHERLFECEHRRGIKVAEMVRMAFRYFDKLKRSDTPINLEYAAGRKTQFIGVENLMMQLDDDETPPDLCAVVNMFMDHKDDGGTNQKINGGMAENGDGSFAAVELPDLAQDKNHRGLNHAIASISGDVVETICRDLFRSPELVSGSGNKINCKSCAEIIRAAKQYSVFQLEPTKQGTY